MSGAINVSSYLDNAVKAWSNAGISSSITTTPANANIKLYGGTRAELIAMGFYYRTDIVGLTYFDSYSAAGTANSVYTINRFSKVSTSVCSEAGASYYTNVVMHEYGHALGWMGHASDAGDVMHFQATAGNISLTSHDKKQLLQIYSAMN